LRLWPRAITHTARMWSLQYALGRIPAAHRFSYGLTLHLNTRRTQRTQRTHTTSQLSNTVMFESLYTYRYSPLPLVSDIRLLRLMSHKDNTAPIQCQLFDYSLQESGTRTHLYEALSYAWGSLDKLRSISIDKYNLPVTVNLHAALLCLRDRFIERII
jgi:hypothetical protein